MSSSLRRVRAVGNDPKSIARNFGYLQKALRLVGGTKAAGGANLIGYDDSGDKTSAATVADALDEIYAHLISSVGHIDLPLLGFRATSSGDVGDTSANGGVLASDTTPILEGGGSTHAQRLTWAATVVTPVTIAVSLPAWFNGAVGATVDLICASAGTTDDFDAVIITNWDGGADVTDTVDDTAATAVHVSSAPVAAGDIPDAPLCVSVTITPPTHATDAFYLYGARIRCTRKLAS